MERLSQVLFRPAPDRLGFWCPGCLTHHLVKVEGPGAWGWNRDVHFPTFTPSVLVTCPGGRPDDRCHSFVDGGRIRFLDDCTHALAGKTLPLAILPGRIPFYEGAPEEEDEP